MSAFDLAAAIAKMFEGFFPKPYRCPANVPTIGYGTTRYPDGRKVTMQDAPIDETRAEELLSWEMAKARSAALRYCPGLIADDKKLAAISDFVYNLGAGNLQSSTLRRKINSGDWQEAKRELMKWVRGGGRILPGLVKRRTVEASFIG